MGPGRPFSQAMLYRLFQSYIEPLLTKKPKGQTNIELLFDMGERGFKAGIGKEEGRAVGSYLKVCEKLHADPARKKELEDIFSAVLAEVEYDATYRLNEAMITTSGGQNRIRADLVLYTALLENFVRAFLTPIYYFVHIYYKAQKGGAQSPDAYVNVGIAPKIDLISSVTLAVPGVDLKSLTKGIDMRIRHGGTAHEHWTVLDDDTVEIKTIRSATGEVSDKFILTKKELSDKLEELEKLVWVLRAGFYVFMVNSEMKLPAPKPRTKLGIEHFCANFAKGRVVDLAVPFGWYENKEEIEIKISHTPQEIELPGGQIYMATGGFDIIQKIFKVPYIYQILDVAKYIAHFIDENKYKRIKVTASLEGKDIMEATYLVADLLKDVDTKKSVITHVEGSAIDANVLLTWVGQLTVPIGFKDVMIKELKAQFPDSDFI